AVTQGLRIAFVRVHPAYNQRKEALGGILCEGKPNPPTHRVATIMGRAEGEVVQHREDITHPRVCRIGFDIVRFVAEPMSSGIHEEKPIVVLQSFHVAIVAPALQTGTDPVLKHQHGSLPFDFVVDADALVVSVWHRCPPPRGILNPARYHSIRMEPLPLSDKPIFSPLPTVYNY